MIDRYQLTKDILALADSTPLSNIDIAPIIERYSANLEMEQQRSLRVTIMAILRELKENKEIDYYEGNFMITASQAGVFMGNGGMIRSTHKRQTEIEKSKPMATAAANKKIQLATRRNILDGFLITRVSWNGNLDQPSFL
jgi:hypothetical protein